MDNKEQIEQKLELPKPQPNALQAPASPAEVVGGSGEQPGVHMPDPAAQSAQANSVAQAIVSQQPAASSQQATIATAHLTAADVDLIEKEWVQKAKDIVARTHGDPYTQNNEINKIKADYIKKRYNKDIKILSES